MSKVLEDATPEEMAQELARRKCTFVLCNKMEGTRRLIAFQGITGTNLEMLQMAANELMRQLMNMMPEELKPSAKQGPDWVAEELAKP